TNSANAPGTESNAQVHPARGPLGNTPRSFSRAPASPAGSDATDEPRSVLGSSMTVASGAPPVSHVRSDCRSAGPALGCDPTSFARSASDPGGSDRLPHGRHAHPGAWQ